MINYKIISSVHFFFPQTLELWGKFHKKEKEMRQEVTFTELPDIPEIK